MSRIREDEWMGPEELRAARLRCGLSRQKAAENLGLSLEMYGKLEQGRRKPSLKSAIRIHQFFNVPNPKLGVK